MAIRERLVYAIDVITDGASKGLSNFRSSVSQAEGTVGKFKAGASSAFDTVKANAGALALGAGAALATFGAKAVAAFQETAIEAGKFSDATGLAVEDASRWIEVAGDVGVSAETMQGAFVKLNKALSTGDLEKFGVELQRTSTGAVDVNATMLNAIKVIGGIEDPTKRAEAAQKAFGRSYAEAAEIIFDNADNVAKKLDEVSDAKVIDQKELEQARKFRAAMDDLHDALEDLAIAAGESLVPALTDIAKSLRDISDTANDLKVPDLLKFGVENTALARVRQFGGAIKDLFSDDTDKRVESFVNTAHNLAGVARGEAAAGLNELADATAETGRRTQQMHESVDLATASLEAEAKATDRAREAAQLHASALEKQQDAILGSLDALYDYESAALDTADAVQDMNDTVGDSESTLADARRAQIDAAQAALSQAQAYAQSKGALDGSTLSAQLQLAELNRLAAKFPELSAFIQGYINSLNSIPSVKSTQLVVTSSGGFTTKQTKNQFGRLVAGAEGAIVNRPTMALIGEAGPEAVVPLSQSPGNSPLPGGSGGTYNVTLNVQQALTPEEVVTLIKKHERFAGASWRGG